MGVGTLYFIYVCCISGDQKDGLLVNSELEWTLNKAVMTCWEDSWITRKTTDRIIAV
jgi:hypothetical protein